MFKPILHRLSAADYLFKQFEEVPPKTLGLRHRLRIFSAVDPDGYFAAVYVVEQKSRVLTKDLEKFAMIHRKLEHHTDRTIHIKILILDAPLCSKAAVAFKAAGWVIL